MRSIFTAVAVTCALGVAPSPVMASSISTASEAIAYLFDNELVPETDTTRVYELAESIKPGIHRWRVSFLSETDFTAIKINADLETGVLSQSDDTSLLFSAAFADRLPEARKTPMGQKFVDKAREIIKADYPDSVVEPGHISLYKICLAPSKDETSRYKNGCRRKQPFEQWNVFIRLTPPAGDWVVKKVVFVDGEAPVVSEGPRGFFE